MATESRGSSAEDRIQLLAEGPFFSDFVFRNPAYMKGSLLREAADILIWFSDTLVIIQSKARTIDDRKLLLPFGWRERSWAAKNLKRAFGQVRRSRTVLLDGRVPSLVNPRRGEVLFVPSAIRRVFGVVVMDQLVEPYDPLAIVPDLQRAPLPIHVFAMSDWPLLCSELSTTSDFMDYLAFRSLHLGRAPFLVGREADLLALFLMNERDPFADFENFPHIHGLGIWFGENLKAQRAARDADDRWSLLIDDIIEHLHDVDDNLPVDASLPRAKEHDDYTAAAVELSKLNRLERRLFGRKLAEKINVASAERRDRYFAVPGRDDGGFLFLASLRSRQERCRNLLALTALAKHRLKTSTMVGVATEASVGKGRSYDTVYLQYPWAPDEEGDELAVSRFSTPLELSDSEFPDRRAVASRLVTPVC